MQVIYQGKDIYPQISVHSCEIIDNAGGKADSVEIQFSDPVGVWSAYKPKRGDTLEVIYKGYRSGICIADAISQDRGICTVMATSLPLNCKTPRTQAWENIRLFELAAEIAGRYGFVFRPYEVENYLYKRVEQIGMTDFAFLTQRCQLEGYALKITDKAVVIYNERMFETTAPARTIYKHEVDGDKYNLRQKTSDIYKSCAVSYGEHTGSTTDNKIEGSDFAVSDIYVGSVAEAKRFSAGLLRAKNKQEYTGSIPILIDPKLAAGVTIRLSGFGLSDGIYFIETATHNTSAERTILKIRQTLEGY